MIDDIPHDVTVSFRYLFIVRREMMLQESYPISKLQKYLLLKHFDVTILTNLVKLAEHCITNTIAAMETQDIKVHFDLFDCLHSTTLKLH